MYLKLLPFLFLLSCASSKKSITENESDVSRLHDIWSLVSINGKDLPNDLSKSPVLEIFVETKTIMGNDGCNNFSGSIKTISNTDLSFGPLMATKMACPNMVFSRQFNSNLSATRGYKMKNLVLVLLDENNEELLQFKKVD